MAPLDKLLRKRYLVNAYVEHIAETTTENELRSHLLTKLGSSLPGLEVDVKPFFLDDQTNEKFSTVILTVYGKKKGRKAIECFNQEQTRLIDSHGNASHHIFVDFSCQRLLTLARRGEPTFDVCFVHGLGGHALKTFSSKGKEASSLTLWPRDLLPGLLDTDEHHGQYMTFGYDAPVLTGDLVPAKINETAEDLLNKLIQARGRACQRPIYFICHSLGGLVVCQAASLATRGDLDPDSRTTFFEPFHAGGACTIRGVIFFGTPFKGDHLAWLATFLIRKTVILRGLINATTLSYLSVGNENVKEFTEEFRDWTERLEIPVMTFYERRKLKKGPLKKVEIVEKDNAKGYFDTSLVRHYPVKADHASMVKFDGPHDPIYEGDVAAPLKELVHASLVPSSLSFHPLEVRPVTREPVRPGAQSALEPHLHAETSQAANVRVPMEEISERPDFNYMSARELLDRADAVYDKILSNRTGSIEAPPNIAFAGTCDWIFEQDRITRLLERQGNDCLFIEAGGGWGKSVLAAYLINMFQSCQRDDPSMPRNPLQNDTLVCFSLSQKGRGTRTLKLILEDILAKIAAVHPAIVRDTIHTTMQSRTRQSNVQFYWALLRKVRRQIKQDIICVVDGLDECIDDKIAPHRTTADEEMVEFLRTACRLVYERESRTHGRVKMIFTTRPKAEISLAAQAESLPNDPFDFRMTVRKQELAAGFLEFVKQRVAALSVDRDLPPAHKELMIERITERCSPIFQLAHLLLQPIQFQRVNFNDKDAIMHCISNFKLDSISANYRDQLKRIEARNREKAADLFRLLYFAQDDINIEDIRGALAVDIDSSNFEDFRGRVRAGNADFIRRGACGSLIRIERGGDRLEPAEKDIVVLDHPTVKEFLGGISPEGNLRIFSCQNEELGNLYLARLCVKCLIFWAELLVLSLTEDIPESEMNTCFQFAQYAACYWTVHARKAGKTVLKHLPFFAELVGTTGSLTTSFRAMFLLRHDIMQDADGEATLMAPDDFLAINDLHHLLPLFYKENFQKRSMYMILRRKKRTIQKRAWDHMIHAEDPSRHHRTILHQACAHGSLHAACYLLTCGARGAVQDDDGQTPFSVAVDEGHQDIALLLLVLGDAIERTRDVRNITSLHMACSNGMTSVVSILLCSNLDVNAKSFDDWTPVHIAAQQGRDEILELLLAKGGMPHSKKSGGTTPLHLAAEKGHLNAIRLLLKATEDEDVLPVTDNNLTPLYAAARGGHVRAFQLLAQRQREVEADANGWLPIHAAAVGGHLAIVVLLKDSPTLRNRTSSGRDALHLAAASHNRELVKYLVIDLKWDVHLLCDDLVVPNGEPPRRTINALFVAIEAGDEDVANFLLDQGSDVNVTNFRNSTLIHKAAASGCKSLIDRLASLGVSRYSQDSEGCMSLHYATGSGHQDIVKSILEDYAEEDASRIDLGDSIGRSALHYACNEGLDEIVRMLLGGNADVNLLDFHGNTPCLYAAAGGHVKVLKLLLESNADFKVRNDNGDTALHMAAISRPGECIDALSNMPDIQIDAQNQSGNSPLIEAARRLKKQAIIALLARGANPIAIRNKCGLNAMDILRNWSSIQPHLRNWISQYDGPSPLHVKRKTKQRIAELLSKYSEQQGWSKDVMMLDLWGCYQLSGDTNAARVCFEYYLVKLSNGDTLHRNSLCSICTKQSLVGEIRVCSVCPDSGICAACHEDNPDKRPEGCSAEHEQYIVGGDAWRALGEGEAVPGRTLDQWIEDQRVLYPYTPEEESAPRAPDNSNAEVIVNGDRGAAQDTMGSPGAAQDPVRGPATHAPGDGPIDVNPETEIIVDEAAPAISTSEPEAFVEARPCPINSSPETEATINTPAAPIISHRKTTATVNTGAAEDAMAGPSRRPETLFMRNGDSFELTMNGSTSSSTRNVSADVNSVIAALHNRRSPASSDIAREIGRASTWNGTSSILSNADDIDIVRRTSTDLAGLRTRILQPRPSRS